MSNTVTTQLSMVGPGFFRCLTRLSYDHEGTRDRPSVVTISVPPLTEELEEEAPLPVVKVLGSGNVEEWLAVGAWNALQLQPGSAVTVELDSDNAGVSTITAWVTSGAARASPRRLKSQHTNERRKSGCAAGPARTAPELDPGRSPVESVSPRLRATGSSSVGQRRRRRMVH